jgi:hypothetical protein
VSITSQDIGSRNFVYTPTPGTLTFSLPASTSKYSVLTIKTFLRKFKNTFIGVHYISTRILVPVITVFWSSGVFE